MYFYFYSYSFYHQLIWKGDGKSVTKLVFYFWAVIKRCFVLCCDPFFARGQGPRRELPIHTDGAGGGGGGGLTWNEEEEKIRIAMTLLFLLLIPPPRKIGTLAPVIDLSRYGVPFQVAGCLFGAKTAIQIMHHPFVVVPLPIVIFKMSVCTEYGVTKD